MSVFIALGENGWASVGRLREGDVELTDNEVQARIDAADAARTVVLNAAAADQQNRFDQLAAKFDADTAAEILGYRPRREDEGDRG